MVTSVIPWVVLDTEEIGNRVSLYVNGANSVHQVPIAEALIMCKTKGSGPFLSIIVWNMEYYNKTSVNMRKISIIEVFFCNKYLIKSSAGKEVNDVWG